MTAPGPDSHTIVVTDSGLGGLSVYAGILKGLSRTAAPGSGINLIYVNAWPEKDRGYNHYPDMARKAAVFDRALAAMAALRPDTLVIACNTLSVIYPHTEFFQTTRIPVHDIIGQGVNLVADLLAKKPETGIILFGTPTTAQSQVHAHELTHKGIALDRIITQGCTGLAGTIERNPFDPSINLMIQDNVDQAMAKGGNRFHPLAAALCCTHFGYCEDLFASALARHTGAPPEILNPNQGLAEQVVMETGKQGFFSSADRMPGLNLQILSRIPFEPLRIQSYATLFESHAPRVAAALNHYQYLPDLFHIPEQGDPSS
jgi:glutamate racemase